jgi:3D (Asp-Asp-Asp) domain-containing protein
MGTCLEIEGLGRRYVQDVGGAIKGRALDVFYYSHSDALRFGRREMRVRGCV